MRCLRPSTGCLCCMPGASSPTAARNKLSIARRCVKSIWEFPLMPEPLLRVEALDAFYGDFQALFGVSLRVEAGQVVAIIGANGAGKSTLLKTIAGLMPSRPDAITFAGEAIGKVPAYRVLARGIALVPEG